MSELAFEKWVKQSLPFVELEDWTVPIIHRNKGRKVLRERHPNYGGLIDKWEKQSIYATPDYLLKVSGKPILWVDVKDTQRISNPFNLNAIKYADYLRVADDTSVRASIVVFERDSKSPKKWGYILPGQYNHIPLFDISTLEAELQQLARLAI